MTFLPAGSRGLGPGLRCEVYTFGVSRVSVRPAFSACTSQVRFRFLRYVTKQRFVFFFWFCYNTSPLDHTFHPVFVHKVKVIWTLVVKNTPIIFFLFFLGIFC